MVHMHLAWLYVLHAELTRDGVDYRYWSQQGRSRRLERVDDEPKRWELTKCVRYRWPNEKDPVTANLMFFVGLRNKFEHRYARQQESLTTVVSGQVQALLLNYEEELTSQFGVGSSLATRLRFPVFIRSFTDEGERTLRRLRAQLPRRCGHSSRNTMPGLMIQLPAAPAMSCAFGCSRSSPRKTPTL